MFSPGPPETERVLRSGVRDPRGSVQIFPPSSRVSARPRDLREAFRETGDSQQLRQTGDRDQYVLRVVQPAAVTKRVGFDGRLACHFSDCGDALILTASTAAAFGRVRADQHSEHGEDHHGNGKIPLRFDGKQGNAGKSEVHGLFLS